MKSDQLLSSQELSALRIQAGKIISSDSSLYKLDSREAGWLPTSALGSGMDYAESRVYHQGDDPRTINWRLSARSTETFVKNYHMEARPSLCIVLDQRRSMIFGTTKRLKITQALRFTSLLAYAAEQHRLTLQIMLIDDDVHWFDTQTSEEFLQLVNHANLSAEVKPEANIEEAFYDLNQRLKTGSLLYIISDFLDLKTTHNKLVLQLQERYFVQALHIIDQAEKILPSENYVKGGGVSFDNIQRTTLQDMNSEASLSFNPANQSANKSLKNTLEDHFNQIKQTLLKSAIVYSPAFTYEDTIHTHITLPLGH